MGLNIVFGSKVKDRSMTVHELTEYNRKLEQRLIEVENFNNVLLMEKMGMSPLEIEEMVLLQSQEEVVVEETPTGPIIEREILPNIDPILNNIPKDTIHELQLDIVTDHNRLAESIHEVIVPDNPIIDWGDNKILGGDQSVDMLPIMDGDIMSPIIEDVPMADNLIKLSSGSNVEESFPIFDHPNNKVDGGE